MSKDLNKWMGIGRLGKDPEVKFLQNGNQLAKITIACSGDYNDKSTGKKIEVTEWVSIVFFNRLAEVAEKYLKKGSRVYAEGRLQTRKWQDNDGQDRYATEIVGNEMQMLGGGAGQREGGETVKETYANKQTKETSRKNENGTQKSLSSPPQEQQEFDDDIPF